jgi:phage terminase small subunit
MSTKITKNGNLFLQAPVIKPLARKGNQSEDCCLKIFCSDWTILRYAHRAASSQENIIVKENSGTFTLSCKVEAYPRKMVYWLRYMGMSDGRETYTGNVL